MTDEQARRQHELDQRHAQIRDAADEAATFYLQLRRRKVPAGAAQGITEAWVAATVGDVEPDEGWTP